MSRLTMPNNPLSHEFAAGTATATAAAATNAACFCRCYDHNLCRGIVVLRKTHTLYAPSIRNIPKAGIQTVTKPLMLLNRLVGLVVRRQPRELKNPGSNPACAGIFFRGRVIPVTLAPQWLPCQAPGVIGSALGLVGPVSIYCDWVR